MNYSASDMPFVSIIIPVFNREKCIGECINSLLRQDYPKNKYEIIVVDNNSKDRTKTVVSKYPVKLLEEKKRQSPGAARNRGIKEAQGQIFAFIDSDEKADSSWLSTIVKKMLDEKADIVTGVVKPFMKERNIWSLYTVILEKRAMTKYFGNTENLLVKKQVFEEIGLFLDNAKSMEDLEFIERVKSAGYKKTYILKPLVYHRAKSSFSEIVERAFRFGMGEGKVLKLKSVLCANFFKQFFPGFRTFLKYLEKGEINTSEYLKLLLVNIIFGVTRNTARIFGTISELIRK